MFQLNPDTIYLIESMKTDGYWSIKNKEASIQNKNLPFLQRIEQILSDNKVNSYKKNDSQS